MNNYPYQKLLFFIVLVITILYWGTAKSEVYEPKNHAFDCLAQNIYFETKIGAIMSRYDCSCTSNNE